MINCGGFLNLWLEASKLVSPCNCNTSWFGAYRFLKIGRNWSIFYFSSSKSERKRRWIGHLPFWGQKNAWWLLCISFLLAIQEGINSSTTNSPYMSELRLLHRWLYNVLKTPFGVWLIVQWTSLQTDKGGRRNMKLNWMCYFRSVYSKTGRDRIKTEWMMNVD